MEWSLRISADPSSLASVMEKGVPMKTRILVVLVLAAWIWQTPLVSRADVVVLANRTAEDVRFTRTGDSHTYTLAKGEVLTLPLTRDGEIVFTAGGKRHQCRVRLNEIYCFVGEAKAMQLKQIGFSGTWRKPEEGDDKQAAERRDVGSHAERRNEKIQLKVPVKILVDQAEPTVQRVWEKRLRQRVANASDILERYCRVKLEVIEVGEWKSDAKLTKLAELLGDFRKKVAPGKARLVLGFTGLRAPKDGSDRALGCTPGPMQTHILIREYRPRTEPERLEVLVHELGHFLGAAHSPENDSAMRPKLGDGRANLRAFRIGYDPVNTLVMNLVAEEMARRPLHGFGELSAPTRRRLLDIFATMARATPDDPAAAHFVRMLGAAPPEPMTVRAVPQAALDGARAVVRAIVAEAKQNRERVQRGGDALTEHYCRVAAEACRRVPAEQAATAYTLGLAVALDRTELLRSLGLRGIAWSKIESDDERQQRLKVLGEPTMHGRASLTQSFAVSAAVLMLVEGQAVSAAGLQEELLQRQGGDRFRFDDLTASLAGITFATQLDASPTLLDELAKSFRVADYVLPPKGLPQSIDRDEFNRQYGSTSDERFLEKQDELRKRLLALPGYQPRK
jgi:hypothetical protein